MTTVVDANILFAAFIRDGATRHLVLDTDLDLAAPAWAWEEVAARRPFLEQKANIGEDALDRLLQRFQDRIGTLPNEALEPLREKALAAVGAAGAKDAPYVAAAMLLDARLWTHDNDLARALPDLCVTTADLLEETSR